MTLTDVTGATPGTGGRRVVLEAATTDALLLFVDDDRLGYLELAPLDETPHRTFPDPRQLRFDG